jgi:hypothetical protein
MILALGQPLRTRPQPWDRAFLSARREGASQAGRNRHTQQYRPRARMDQPVRHFGG